MSFHVTIFQYLRNNLKGLKADPLITNNIIQVTWKGYVGAEQWTFCPFLNIEIFLSPKIMFSRFFVIRKYI